MNTSPLLTNVAVAVLAFSGTGASAQDRAAPKDRYVTVGGHVALVDHNYQVKDVIQLNGGH